MKYAKVGRLFRRVRVSWLSLFAVPIAAFSLVVGSVPAVAAPSLPSAAVSHSAFRPGVPKLLTSARLNRPVPRVPGGSGAGISSGVMSQPVREFVRDRTATTSTWVNADGSMTVRRYLGPHFYKSGSGWLPISPVLARTVGRAGWWHSRANSWGVSFGPAGAAGGAEQLSVDGARIGFAPLGVADRSLAPVVSGATATYDGVWPGTDLSEQVLPSGVKEQIVLTGPGAGSSFAFRVAGARVRPDAVGGLVVLAGGRQVGTVPPLTVSAHVAARPQQKLAGVGARDGAVDLAGAAGARLTVSGDVVRVSVSPRWLAGLPSSAYGADQLTGTLSGGTANPGTYTYDTHGNQTADGSTQLTWDASDRLASTTATGTATTYAYDALNRVTTRQTGTTTTGYWYTGYSDSPSGTLDANGNITSVFVSLPGGVSVTVQPSGNLWSYPDLHGNYTCVTNGSGTLQGSPAAYDPWGQLVTGSQPVANAPGSSDLGAYGTDGKVTDTSTGIIIMGARAYNPAEARFLSVDPVQGGCANPYTYAYGDPINHPDPTGQAACQDTSDSMTLSCGPHLSWVSIGFSCTFSIGPEKARQLAARLGGVKGQIGVGLAGALFCGAGTLELTPIASVIVGGACGLVASFDATQLVDWLNKAADNNEYAEITASGSIGFNGVKGHLSSTFVPAVPCD